MLLLVQQTLSILSRIISDIGKNVIEIMGCSQALLGLDEAFDFAELANDGSVLLVFLVEDFGVFEVVDEAVKSLQASIRKVADLSKL